ncbi:MAG: hypothetical protein IKI09_05185, partial [Bacteroidales bacterium]|nr:hypothetical protein [Bacteroidales bacterium]
LSDIYLPFKGQFAVQLAQPLPFFFPLCSPQEQVPLPLCKAFKAITTKAKTTNSTMAVGRFMR